MKKLLLILVVILPILAMSQGYNYPSTVLKSLDEKTTRSSDLFADDRSVLLFFFNETSPEVIENFEYLADLESNIEFNRENKVIAIYSNTSGSQANIRPFIDGNNIEIETYVDMNGEFQRAMGISAQSAIIVFNNDNMLSGRHSGDMACSGELISMVNALHPAVGLCDNESERSLAGNSILNK